MISKFYGSLPFASVVLISLSLILLSGFLVTRLCLNRTLRSRRRPDGFD